MTVPLTPQEARDLAATLAPKSPGHLITAADWNSLVSVLLGYGDALIGLPARVTALEADLSALVTRVQALEDLPDRVQQLEDETAPLRRNYLLTVRTATENVLVAEVAELIYTVRALDGSALTGPMPWLDVFASWGRLRAAPGFVVRENAEENALSVQFNNAGEVRLQLRSQHTKGVTASAEAAIGNAMQAQVGGSGKTVRQVLKASPSPQDPETKLAFQVMHGSYDANANLRIYADAYTGQFSGGRAIGSGYGKYFPAGEWEDYRTTVMAFAKPDANPVTPDPTRGVATIQVNFREWIAHWSNDYIHVLEPVLSTWVSLFEQSKTRPDVLPHVVNELDKLGQATGALGQMRHVQAFEKAADLINPGNDAALAQTKGLLKGAAQLQGAVGGLGAGAAGGYAQAAQAGAQANQTARAAQAVATDAASTKQTVVALEGRIKAAEQTGKEISAGLKNIGDGVNRINVTEVADLGGRLNNVSLQLANLNRKFPGA